MPDPDYDPPQRLRELTSWLTGQAARRADRLVTDALAQENAHRQHFVVLTSLAEQGPASQADLGRRLWIDRSDLHAILTELESQRAIARVRDATDRRRNVVALTDRGFATLARLDARVDAAQEALLAPLSKRDQTELNRLLKRLAEAPLGR